MAGMIVNQQDLPQATLEDVLGEDLGMAWFEPVKRLAVEAGYEPVVVKHVYGSGDTGYLTDGRKVIGRVRFPWNAEMTYRYTIHVCEK